MLRTILLSALLASGSALASGAIAAPAPSVSPAPAATVPSKTPANKPAAKAAKPAAKLVDMVSLDDLTPILTKAGFTITPRQQNGVPFLEAQFPDTPGLDVVVEGLECGTAPKCSAFAMLVALNPSAITSDIRKRVGAEVHYARIITLQDTPVFVGDYIVGGGVTEQNVSLDIRAYLLGLARLSEIVKTEGQSADNSAPGPASPEAAIAQMKQTFASASAPKIFANDPALTAKIVSDVADTH